MSTRPPVGFENLTPPFNIRTKRVKWFTFGIESPYTFQIHDVAGKLVCKDLSNVDAITMLKILNGPFIKRK